MKNRNTYKNIYGIIIALSVIYSFASVLYGSEYSLSIEDLNSTLQVAGLSTILPGSLPPAKQWRTISINPVVTTQNILANGDVINLNLFPNTTYRAQVDRISRNTNGTISVRGRIDGFPLGYVIITTTGNNSFVSIRIPEKDEYYTIRNQSDNGTHYLLEVDMDQLVEYEDAPALIPRPITTQVLQNNILTNNLSSVSTDPVTFDVMIVYTPAARDWASGNIDNIIAQAIELGQLVLDNSNTYVNLNLVYSGLINYTESGDYIEDLKRLTFTSDDYMNEVHTLRNQYSADIVSLFGRLDGIGGVGWVLDNASGDSDYAFSMCNVQQVSWTYTYIHEMGHNMGCGHHKEQNAQPGPGLFDYSAGWRWTGTDNGKYCSVMSYNSGDFYPDGQDHSYTPYFSNPGVQYKDVATGDATNGDNARTIRAVKSVVAGYRTGSSGGGVTTMIDIGLRYYDGNQIVSIACEQGTITSPLRISKNGITYGIILVNPDDSNASGIIIQTSSGPKAMRIFQ